VEAGGVSLRDGQVLMPEDPGKGMRWQTGAQHVGGEHATEVVRVGARG